jgi:acetate kinase
MLDHVVTLNAGSSSVKFALFEAAAHWPRLVAHGEVERIGEAPRFKSEIAGGARRDETVAARDHEQAIRAILDWIETAFDGLAIGAIGHRIVHGGLHYAAPAIVDQTMLDELKSLAPLAPLHQPHNIAGVEAARAAFPHAPQVACFDTAFHRGHAFVNDAYALPRAYYERGVRRFGFHGLSYEYIARRLREIEPVVACGRVIVAHLGAGASLCAMKDGRSIASTMGFSALEGLAMGTRCGEIDPGLLLYLLDHDKMSTSELSHLLYERSGLKGLSGLSHDMRALEASDSPQAKDAIAYFIHRLRMEIGALTAALAGVDALIFTAGIGEHSAHVRAGALAGMEWLGFALDERANRKDATRISGESSKPVLVLATDEEKMIAHHTVKVAGLAPASRAA